MSEIKRGTKVHAKIIKDMSGRSNAEPIRKAETSTQIEMQEAFNGSEWIQHPFDLRIFERYVSESSILPQCIRSYRNNIPGFGIGIRYVEDTEETPEMIAEFNKAEEIIELLTIEQDTKEIFEDIIEARETYGISYIEVIRNLSNEVVQIEFIRNTPSIIKTEPIEPYVPFTYYHHGTSLTRNRKFRKYRQDIGGKTVYYKEFGDPRIMDRRDGKYVESGTLERRWQANEILEFPIGTKPYGEVRWIGQLLGVDGSRRAEGLNNNYFINGRHTPLLIMLQGGTLTDESYDRLQDYMNGIKGENGQHAFIILEAENAEQRTDFDTSDKPEIEIKDLASILQKDELFQDYLENNRKRIQSAFLLPDLYVGYTTDFNRATAQTAKEVTEEQVFQPERISLAWIINNKLLNGYQFKYVEAYFLAPNITNPDDLYKILTVSNNAGGLTPNKAKDVVYRMLGETSEDYEEEWGDIPLKIYTERNSSVTGTNSITAQLTQQIQKAQSNNTPDEVVAVMKSVQKLLKEIKKQEEEKHEAECRPFT